jgi:hypothetical protein
VSGEASASDEPGRREARGRGLDPARVAKYVRRITPIVAFVCVGVLWLNFGWLRVPAGMDTTPSAPPGSLCIIRKRPGPAAVGSLVFANVPGGGVVLSRVVARDGDAVVLRHDDPDSRMPSSEHFGAVPDEEIAAVVISVLLAEETAETRDPRDRVR